MRQADLERKASELLAKHGVAGPPVPVERVAQGEGVSIARRPFDDGDLSGMLYREPKGPTVIAVNSRTAPTRQRFTIAHEIAHLLLHEPTLQVDRTISVRFRDEHSALAVDRDEIEANQFAAALLMKREWVLDDARKLLHQQPGLSDETIAKRLAARYEVSPQAMQFRLANLGLWTPL